MWRLGGGRGVVEHDPIMWLVLASVDTQRVYVAAVEQRAVDVGAQIGRSMLPQV
jgi:hypothetical protein